MLAGFCDQFSIGKQAWYVLVFPQFGGSSALYVEAEDNLGTLSGSL
jgi:hypothetical protein